MRKDDFEVEDSRDGTWGDGSDSSPQWTYLSNHAHVLVCLARDPELRLRDVARLVGLTERGVSRILSELENSGILEKERVGRRNRYKLHLDTPLRHPLEKHATVADLMGLVALTPVAKSSE